MARMSTRVMSESYVGTPRADMFDPAALLVPQRVDWVELGCALRGEHAEDQTDAHGDHHCDECKSDRDSGVDFHRQSRQPAESQADENTERAAEPGEGCRFDQKLKKNFFSRRTQSFTDTDLAGPTRDRHHHDRH